LEQQVFCFLKVGADPPLLRDFDPPYSLARRAHTASVQPFTIGCPQANKKTSDPVMAEEPSTGTEVRKVSLAEWWRDYLW
jgi:hypothetical protein